MPRISVSMCRSASLWPLCLVATLILMGQAREHAEASGALTPPFSDRRAGDLKPRAARKSARPASIYFEFSNAGFGSFLTDCPDYAEDRRKICESVREKMAALLKRAMVSRREHARRYVKHYLDGTFADLLDCLGTGCGGAFVLDGASGPAWAASWRRMLAFQACIHAVPAVTDEIIGVTEGYKASSRLRAAIEGLVPECAAGDLSPDEQKILLRFNFAGAF